MKSLAVILTYLGTSVLFFILLSAVGYAFSNYTWSEVVTSDWRIFYIIFIHWLPASIISMEVNASLGKPL